MIKIVAAQSGEALEHLITLSQEYVTWMLAEVRERYPQLDRQDFASERQYDDIHKKFPGEHVPPDGCLLVALHGETVCGSIALGRLTPDICEVRTLYVRPACRGIGAAKTLVEAVLDEARTLGYRAARLDTLAFMTGAQTLYHSLGFYPIEAYHPVASSVAPYIRFFECSLTDEKTNEDSQTAVS
jgi:GNAT superfamily N-acetyltransferase